MRLAEASDAVGRAAEVWPCVAAGVLAPLALHVDVVVQLVRLAEASDAVGRAAEDGLRGAAAPLAHRTLARLRVLRTERPLRAQHAGLQ